MSYILKSFKRGYIGDGIGNFIVMIKGDTRSLDYYSSHTHSFAVKPVSWASRRSVDKNATLRPRDLKQRKVLQQLPLFTARPLNIGRLGFGLLALCKGLLLWIDRSSRGGIKVPVGLGVRLSKGLDSWGVRSCLLCGLKYYQRSSQGKGPASTLKAWQGSGFCVEHFVSYFCW